MKHFIEAIAGALCMVACAATPAYGADQYPAYYFGNTANNNGYPMQGETTEEFETRIAEWKMYTEDGVEYTLKNIQILDRYGVPVFDPGINIRNLDTDESLGAPGMDVHIGYDQEVELVPNKYGYYVIPTTTKPIDVVFNVTYRTLIVKESAGIENAVCGQADGEVRYFNLQGQPVSGNAPGLYIMVKNGKAVKVLK